MQKTYHKHAKELIQLLRRGKIIDPIKYPELYSAMNSDVVLEQINDHFCVLDLVCSKTSDGMGFYLRSTVDDKETLSVAEDMIKEVVKNIRPLVEWMQFTRIISADDLVITTSTTISKERLLHCLEQPQAQAMIREIADKFSRKGEVISSDSGKHLEVVMGWLERNDYVLKVDNGLSYIGLAKWSVVEDVLKYLVKINNIPRAEEPVQESLV